MTALMWNAWNSQISNSIKQNNRCQRLGSGCREELLFNENSLFYKIKEFWRWRVEWLHSKMWIYLISPNCTLKIVKIVHFMLFITYLTLRCTCFWMVNIPWTLRILRDGARLALPYLLHLLFLEDLFRNAGVPTSLFILWGFSFSVVIVISFLLHCVLRMTKDTEAQSGHSLLASVASAWNISLVRNAKNENQKGVSGNWTIKFTDFRIRILVTLTWWFLHAGMINVFPK